MDFSQLAQTHSHIDRARSTVVDAYMKLHRAAGLARTGGNEALAVQIEKIGRDALALDFTIPPPKG
jgi:hypothetical protein